MPRTKRKKSKRKKASPKRVSSKRKMGEKAKKKTGLRTRSKRNRKRECTRSQSRIPMQLEIRYRIKRNFAVDLSQDISPGGIFIKTPDPLPKGTHVELRFFDSHHSQSSRQIHVEGKVVWSCGPKEASKDQFGMGIEFTRIDVEGQNFIDNLINDFLRKVSIV